MSQFENDLKNLMEEFRGKSTGKDESFAAILQKTEQLQAKRRIKIRYRRTGLFTLTAVVSLTIVTVLYQTPGLRHSPAVAETAYLPEVNEGNGPEQSGNQVYPISLPADGYSGPDSNLLSGRPNARILPEQRKPHLSPSLQLGQQLAGLKLNSPGNHTRESISSSHPSARNQPTKVPVSSPVVSDSTANTRENPGGFSGEPVSPETQLLPIENNLLPDKTPVFLSGYTPRPVHTPFRHLCRGVPRPLTERDKGRNRFAIGMRFKPFVSKSEIYPQNPVNILGNPQWDQVFLDERQSEDHWAFGFNLGFSASYQPVRYFRLETGISYTLYNFTFDFKDSSTVGNFPNVPNDELFDTNTDNATGIQFGNASYIRFPLAASVVCPIRSFEIGFSVSMSIDVLVAAETYTYQTSTQLLKHYRYEYGDQVYHDFTASLTFGLPVGYTWKEKLRFFVIPEYTLMTSSIHHNFYMYGQMPTSMGLSFGVDYIFPKKVKKQMN